MAEQRTRTSRHAEALADLMQRSAEGRIDRRRLAQRAAAFGLSVPALGAAFAGARRVAARQEGTPVGEPDLANLSPGIPDPSEPVTITFASWVTTGSETMEAMRDQFQQLHPNI